MVSYIGAKCPYSVRNLLLLSFMLQNCDISLVQALYGYVRAGRLKDTIDLCRKSHQTEAQSGINIQFCDAIATEPREDDPMIMDADDIETWHGNRRRRLWKSTCIRAAPNVRVFLLS
jgi:nuclear pore complex protein Nup107